MTATATVMIWTPFRGIGPVAQGGLNVVKLNGLVNNRSSKILLV